MGVELSFHPEAVEEAAAAREWYAERSPRAADAFVAELERGFAVLQEAPHRWPEDVTGTRRLLLRRFPFALIYALRVDRVLVLAVAHLHRRPGYWRDRRE